MPKAAQSAAQTSTLTIRALNADDLDAVVAIDAAIEGRTRRDYIERRLQAAQREPTLHAQFAAIDADGLQGFILGRVLAGEFGRQQRAVRLELMGVTSNRRRGGVGRALFDALAGWARRHEVVEVRTAASWRDTGNLAWFNSLGFELAPDQIVASTVDARAYAPGLDESLEAPGDREIDYGRPEANDHERLARDGAEVRSMTAADLDPIVRIDRVITGNDRRAYMAARFNEALEDSAVRVSLCARCDDTVVGYLMARADLGDFGRTDRVAVIDTLGVDPDYTHRGIGRALLAQLFANLDALRVERVETVLPLDDQLLRRFLTAAGFAPGEQLSFACRLDPAP